VFAAIVLAGIDWQYLLLPFIDRSRLVEHAWHEADRGWYPLYPRFLAGVRARTKAGESIAIVAPPRRWEGGYDYAYYRASYLLAGRIVLPAIDRQDVPRPENLRGADFIAVWGRTVRPDQRGVVWRGEGGALLRQR
jgi:hypothetical protein